MCFSAPKINLKEKPKVVERPDASKSAEEETRRRLRGRQGRSGTVLTSALGDPGFAQSAARTALGGSVAAN